MSELTLLLIRIAYLAVLWIFVLSAISVIRSDMFGARVPETARTPEPRGRESKPKKPASPMSAKTDSAHRPTPRPVPSVAGAAPIATAKSVSP